MRYEDAAERVAALGTLSQGRQDVVSDRPAGAAEACSHLASGAGELVLILGDIERRLFGAAPTNLKGAADGNAPSSPPLAVSLSMAHQSLREARGVALSILERI